MSPRGLAAFVALVLACAPATAHAQSGATSVDLVVTPAAARGLDVEQVREGLAQELGCDVRLVDRARRPRPGVATLTVRTRGGHLELERVRDDGSRMVRRSEVPDHEGERVATLVILAANMLRDEASELLDLLRRPDPPSRTTAPVPEAPPITETAAVTEPEPETTAASATSTLTEVAAPVPDVVVRGSSATTEVSTSAPPAPSPSAPGPAFLRIGIDAQLGSVPRGAGSEFTMLGGLELALMPIPELAIGLRDLGAGVLPGTRRTHVGAALFVELAWSLVPEIALYGQLGAHVQARILEANDPSAGVAPLIVGGVRFQLAREFSIGVETAVHVAATDSFVTYLHSLPQGAVLWTGGLTLLFHVS